MLQAGLPPSPSKSSDARARLLFALGLLARPAYAALVAVLLMHAMVLLLRRGVHDWDLLLVTLLGLLVVPWHHAPPVWRLRRQGRGEDAGNRTSRAYGFAVWLPGLTLGLAFAAAAYAKMDRSGLAWITDGAVRYHFVEDGLNAPFTLGLWVATHPTVAVGLSLAAVLIEALFILVIFARRWQARAAFGLAGAGLMAGFYLFQGVHWWPWLILFVAFLPWNRRETDGGIDGRGDLTWTHAAVIATLVAAQAWASYRAIEIEPLFSNYPMYSSTHDSPAAFDRARARFESAGVDITDRVEAADGRQILLTVIEENDEGLTPALESQLAEFEARYARLHGASPEAVDLILLKQPFDWEAGRYLPPRSEHAGTARLSR